MKWMKGLYWLAYQSALAFQGCMGIVNLIFMIVAWGLDAGKGHPSRVAAIHQSWSIPFFGVVVCIEADLFKSYQQRGLDLDEHLRHWHDGHLPFIFLIVATNLVPMLLGYIAISECAPYPGMSSRDHLLADGREHPNFCYYPLYRDAPFLYPWTDCFLAGIISTSWLLFVHCLPLFCAAIGKCLKGIGDGINAACARICHFLQWPQRVWAAHQARAASRAKKSSRISQLSAIGLLPYLQNARVANDPVVMERAAAWVERQKPASVADIVQYRLVDDFVNCLSLPAIPRTKLLAALNVHQHEQRTSTGMVEVQVVPTGLGVGAHKGYPSAVPSAVPAAVPFGISMGATSELPPLHVMEKQIKAELGIEEGSMVDVIEKASQKLGLTEVKGSLTDKAAACMRALGKL